MSPSPSPSSILSSKIKSRDNFEPNVAPIPVVIGDNDEQLEIVEAIAKDEEKARKLAEMYKAAKDENELLEFKNYELLFKIQELEQNQRKILTKLNTNLEEKKDSLDLELDLTHEDGQQSNENNNNCDKVSVLSSNNN